MILHIARKAEWQTAVAAGHYVTHSLESEGFIHCSTLDQVLLPANTLFQGQADLVLLCISPTLVHAPIVYEDCYQSGQKFPHIYGQLNVDAVNQVVEFLPNSDGSFSLPATLRRSFASLWKRLIARLLHITTRPC